MSNSYFNLLNPIKGTGSPGISLITAVKNRIDTLSETLPTWISQPEVDEIIIVDWCSDQSLIPLVEKYQNGKITLAIVKDQPRWILSCAFNLAARLTKKDKLLKLDADVNLLPGFFKKHELKKGLFFSGNWELARDENEKHLNGIVFLYKNDFFNVNGYNEFIKSYGWDDTDLYERLTSYGLKRIDLSPETMRHIPHEHRTTLQDKTNFLLNIPDKERASVNILINRFITSQFGKWSVENIMSGFKIESTGGNWLICTQDKEEKNVIPEDISIQSQVVALRERLHQLGFTINNDLEKHFTFEEIKLIYYLLVSTEKFPENTVLYNLINKFNYHYSYSINQRNELLHQVNTRIAEMEYLLNERTAELTKLEIIRKDIEQKLWNRDQEFKEMETFLEAKESMIKEKDNLIQLHVKNLHQKDQLLLNTNLAIKESGKKIDLLSEDLKLKIALIDQLENKLTAREREISDITTTIQTITNELQAKTAYIDELGKSLQEKNGSLASLEQLLNDTTSMLHHQEQLILRKNKQISILERQIEDIYKSYSWRFGHFIFSILGKLAFRKK